MNWYQFVDLFQSCGGDMLHVHPHAVEAMSLFYRGIINAGQMLGNMALVNSDNIAIGECMIDKLGNMWGINI